MVSKISKELYFSSTSRTMIELNLLLNDFNVIATYRPSLVIADFHAYRIESVSGGNVPVIPCSLIRQSVDRYFFEKDCKVVWDPTNLLFWVRYL